MAPTAPKPCPADLRVLCRKLKSIEPTQLPRAVPSLIGHVLRCKDPLSTPHDAKLQPNAPESALLTHQLKTTVTTLLTGRSREARFAAIALVKAMVDVGGWEMLRTCEPWTRGLLSIVQKGDPIAFKELAIVTLTRIYTLLHPYQTLVREIATPTLPAFITACLQEAKAQDSLSAPALRLLETTCDCLCTLVPLYPNTFRPMNGQIKAAVRVYLAPTSTDVASIPASLSSASRRLTVSLHYVAGKNSGTDDWAKLTAHVLKELHLTADQVLRLVNEAWEASGDYTRSDVDIRAQPKSGIVSPNELPPWVGLDAGVQRLIGLYQYLSECLANSTKAAVTIPIEAVLDAVSRVCLIARLSPKTQSWEQSLQTKPESSREERDELWSLMPDIHVAATGLMQALLERLGDEITPLVSEMLDHLVRVFNSGIDVSSVRLASYKMLRSILTLAGPTLSKPAVSSLTQLVRAICRELQQDAGVLATGKAAPSNIDPKKNGAVANADLFLQSKPTALDETVSLQPEHREIATRLLSVLLTHLPQRHVPTNLRGLIDKTAILTNDRDAMVASVLNPFLDPSGRTYPSILPHLCRKFPSDQAVEVLRTNLRTDMPRDGNDLVTIDEDESEDANTPEEDPAPETADEAWKTPTLPAAPPLETTLPIQSSSSGQAETLTTHGGFGDLSAITPPTKRKLEEVETAPPKRQVVKQASPEPEVEATVVHNNVEAEEDSDQESIAIDMEGVGSGSEEDD